MADERETRPRILIFATHYLPACKAGGPVQSIQNLVETLGDEFDFHLVTSDRDLGDSSPYSDVPLDRWTEVGKARVFYGTRRALGLSGLSRFFRDIRPDVVYLNSYFSRSFSILPLLARRAGFEGTRCGWVIAPRGEFSAGALAIKSRRKHAFGRIADSFGLHAGLFWQGCSTLEADDIRRQRSGRGESIVVAPNLTQRVGGYLPPTSLATPPPPLEVCFLSRISPKKNLDFAIKTLTGVRVPVRFHVYGPKEDARYAAACELSASRCPGNVEVVWHGEVPHDRVQSTLRRHHLFLFPTRGENFGHVIFESFAAGIPALISNHTPWQDLDDRGVGWVRSLDDVQGFVDVIESCAGMPESEREAMSRAAHAFAESFSRNSTGVTATRSLFREAAATGRQRPRPKSPHPPAHSR